MWLKKVETGQRLPERLLFAFLTLKNRARVPDGSLVIKLEDFSDAQIGQWLAAWNRANVLRSLTYRPELFGTAYNHWIHALLRGDSGWSVGERELFGAFVSRSNQCPF